MKVDYRLITVLGMCVSMAIFGCAREQANLSGSGSLATGAASPGTSTSSDLSFNLSGVLPSDAFATLDVTNGGLDARADSKFSIENGFSTDEAAENTFVYWYVNWTQPNPETNASDPVIFGQGMHTLDSVTLAHTICELEIAENEFELWVVAATADWDPSEAAKWIKEPVIMHWNWYVNWYPEQCDSLPPLPEEDEGRVLEASSDDEIEESSAADADGEDAEVGEGDSSEGEGSSEDEDSSEEEGIESSDNE